VNKEIYKKTKEFYEVKEKFAKIGGTAQILSELRDFINNEEKHGEKDIFLSKLKKYLDEKEREFWKVSAPLATQLCEKLTETAEEYIRGE
jgi:hypothetical protein